MKGARKARRKGELIMANVTFKNEEMAINFIDGLFSAGLHAVASKDEIIIGTFCVIGNVVYFLIAD